MSGLHSLLYYGKQMPAQLFHIYFSPENRAKGGQRLLGIVLAAIEPPIHEGLKAVTQGLEQSGHNQCRANKHYAITPPEQTCQQGLSGEHEYEINDQQDRGQQTIDQRAIDQDINIPQSVTQ
jgi:hypothetical protein